MRPICVAFVSAVCVLASCAHWTAAPRARDPRASEFGEDGLASNALGSPQDSVGGSNRPEPSRPGLASANADEPPFAEHDEFTLAEPSFDVVRFTRAARPSGAAPAWTASFLTWQRRPIETLQLGSGPLRTLVLASLHGDEPLAVRLIERLVEEARGNSPAWNARAVLVVRSPNPDGLAAGTRQNSRGVDLNRNFPTRTFRPDPRQRTGAVAGSELETRFVLRLLYAFRPQRVVHVKSTTDAAGWVLHNRQLAGLGAQLRQAETFQVQELPPDAIPGSLESYVTDVLGFEQITISLPAQHDAETAWRRYRGALLAAVGIESARREGPSFGERRGAPPARNEPSRPGPQRREPSGAAAVAGSDGEDQPVPSKGYFEVPPPPEYAAADE